MVTMSSRWKQLRGWRSGSWSSYRWCRRSIILPPSGPRLIGGSSNARGAPSSSAVGGSAMSLSPEQRSSGARITCGSGNTEHSEFSREERKLLLKLAHEAVLASLEHRELSPSPVPPHLTEPRGAFTTLYFRGELRGCVGHVYPIDSLYRTVSETARAAAFEAARFWPITLDEAAELEISLSVLSPLRAVQPELVEGGRHGLLVRLRQHRGFV